MLLPPRGARPASAPRGCVPASVSRQADGWMDIISGDGRQRLATALLLFCTSQSKAE